MTSASATTRPWRLRLIWRSVKHVRKRRKWRRWRRLRRSKRGIISCLKGTGTLWGILCLRLWPRPGSLKSSTYSSARSSYSSTAPSSSSQAVFPPGRPHCCPPGCPPSSSSPQPPPSASPPHWLSSPTSREQLPLTISLRDFSDRKKYLLKPFFDYLKQYVPNPLQNYISCLIQHKRSFIEISSTEGSDVVIDICESKSDQLYLADSI